jgi:hypothetical protein
MMSMSWGRSIGLWSSSWQQVQLPDSIAAASEASGRIPIQALLAAIEADEQEEAADAGTERLAATEGRNLICL